MALSAELKALTSRTIRVGSRRARLWRAVVTVACVWASFTVPLRIAFGVLPGSEDQRTSEPVSDWFMGVPGVILDYIFDLVFVIDILVGFRTCVMREGTMVTDPSAITSLYVRTWTFWVDLLSVFPFVDVFIWTSAVAHAASRLNRLIKVPRIGEYFTDWRLHSNRPDFLLFVQLTGGILQLGHWFGCAYILISVAEGLGSSLWTLPKDYVSKPWTDQYLIMLFWGNKLVTGLEMETQSPIEPAEQIAILVLALIKMFVIAGLVGSVVGLVANSNQAAAELRAKLLTVNSFMESHRIPGKIRGRVRNYFTTLASRQGGANDDQVLAMMPPRLRTDIALEMNGDLVRKVPLFQNCRSGFIRELVTKLKPEVYDPGDTICAEGEVGREMYFVNRGTVAVEINGKKVGELVEGTFFGEIALMGAGARRTATIRSQTASDLSVLSGSDLSGLLTSFPDQEATMWAWACKRIASDRLRSSFADSVAIDLVSADHFSIIAAIEADAADETRRKFFSKSDPLFTKVFASVFEPHVVEEGEILIAGDEPVEHILFLADGSVQFVVPDGIEDEDDQSAEATMNQLLLGQIAGANVTVFGGITSESPFAVSSEVSQELRLVGTCPNPVLLGLSDVLLKRKASYTITARSRCSIGLLAREKLDELIGRFDIAGQIRSDPLMQEGWTQLETHIKLLVGIRHRESLAASVTRRESIGVLRRKRKSGPSAKQVDAWLKDLAQLEENEEGMSHMAKKDKVLASKLLGQLQDQAIHALAFSTQADEKKAVGRKVVGQGLLRRKA